MKRFAKLSAGYSVVTLLGPVFMLILIPIYTRVLTPADYGVTDVALTLSGLLVIFVSLGIDQALNSFFFDHENDPEHRPNLITTAILSVGTMGVLFGLLLTIGAVSLADTLYKDPNRAPIFYLLAVAMVAVPLYNVLGTALRLRMDLKRMNALGLTNLFATIACSIILVLILRYAATGVVAAFVIASSISCAMALFLARDYLRGKFTRRLFKPLILAGLVLIPGVLGYTLMMNIDRLLLTQFVSQTEIGLYSIANKLGAMASLALTAMWVGWWPLALEMAHRPEAPYQYSRMFDYFMVGSVLIALGIGIFAPEILAIFTRDAYVPAAPYALVLLAFTGPIAVMTNFFSIGLYAHKRTHLLSAAFIIVAITNIALNLVLDPLYGVWGAVWATILSGMVWAVTIYTFSQRVMPVPYRWSRVAALISVYGLLVAAFLFIPELHSNLGVKFAAILALIATVLISGLIPIGQIRLGISAIRHWMTRRLVRHKHGMPPPTD